MITNSHVFHRQQIRKKDPKFIYKTKYRRDDLEEEKYGYDWQAHREAVQHLVPRQYLERT